MSQYSIHHSRPVTTSGAMMSSGLYHECLWSPGLWSQASGPQASGPQASGPQACESPTPLVPRLVVHTA
eukprot:Em0155g1a